MAPLTAERDIQAPPCPSLSLPVSTEAIDKNPHCLPLTLPLGPAHRLCCAPGAAWVPRADPALRAPRARPLIPATTGEGPPPCPSPLCAPPLPPPRQGQALLPSTPPAREGQGRAVPASREGPPQRTSPQVEKETATARSQQPRGRSDARVHGQGTGSAKRGLYTRSTTQPWKEGDWDISHSAHGPEETVPGESGQPQKDKSCVIPLAGGSYRRRTRGDRRRAVAVGGWGGDVEGASDGDR